MLLSRAYARTHSMAGRQRPTPNSRTSRNNAANPANSTPLSSETEMRCNRLNSASNGLSCAVAWIDPICTRNIAILGLTPTCDATVNAIINTTQSATGATKLANVRVRTSRANRKTTPQTAPSTCIRPKANPTIAPAASRLPSTRNAPGATTKLRNTSLPSHNPKHRNSMLRSTVDMICYRNLFTNRRSVNLRHNLGLRLQSRAWQMSQSIVEILRYWPTCAQRKRASFLPRGDTMVPTTLRVTPWNAL